MDKVEQIFTKQLEKLQMDYFDFYLFHNVCEMNIEQYLDDDKYGIYTYLMKQKENGRIRHLGFSSHGSLDVMKRFIEKYGRNMEFCQIQLNWLDWDFQEAKQKIQLLSQYNIPVWVMEPLRGGRLVKLDAASEEKLKALRPEESIPAWSFRFLQSLDSVVVTLSGMSSFEQLKENIAIYESKVPLNENEFDVLTGIGRSMTRGVPCTGCHYCVSHCPKGLDIPMLLNLYNEHSFTDNGFIAPMALMAVSEDKHPDSCIGCRSCEAVCPQSIKISEAMADFAAKLKH
jgi:hypothetical protein